jgi:hypothetical protein
MTDNPVAHAMNWASALSVLGTLVGWLPEIAAGLAAVWYLVLLYDYLFVKGRKSPK